MTNLKLCTSPIRFIMNGTGVSVNTVPLALNNNNNIMIINITKFTIVVCLFSVYPMLSYADLKG